LIFDKDANDGKDYNVEDAGHGPQDPGFAPIVCKETPAKINGGSQAPIGSADVC